MSGEQKNRAFMTGFNPEHFRCRQMESSVQLRRNRRDEFHMKRRYPPSTSQIPQIPSVLLDAIPDLITSEASTGAQMFKLVDAIGSQNVEISAAAMECVRLIIDAERHIDIALVAAEAGLVTKLKALLQDHDLSSKAVYEAINSLVSLSSLSNAKPILDRLVAAGIIEIVLGLLKRQTGVNLSYDIQTPLVWFLGNYSGESIDYRDHLLSIGIIETIEQTMLVPSTTNEQIENSVWAICNQIRSLPAPSSANSQHAFRILQTYIDHPDIKIQSAAVWGLSWLTDNTDLAATFLVHIPFDKLRAFLVNGNEALRPALRLVGNLTSDDPTVEKMCEMGVIGMVLEILVNGEQFTREDGLWTLSNIAFTSQTLAEMIIADERFTYVVRMAGDPLQCIRKHATWVFTNLLVHKSMEIARFLVEHEGFTQLCRNLANIHEQDPEPLINYLNCIGHILALYKNERMLIDLQTQMCEHGVIDALNRLQSHPQKIVYEKSLELLTTFLETDNSSPDIVN